MCFKLISLHFLGKINSDEQGGSKISSVGLHLQWAMGKNMFVYFDYTLTGMNYNVSFQMYLLLDHYQEERDKKRKALEEERRLV